MRWVGTADGLVYCSRLRLTKPVLTVSSGPSPETRSEVKSKGNSASDHNQFFLIFFF